MLSALMFITVLAATGPFLITTTTLETSMSANYRTSTQALYAAEAGINRLVRKYRNDPTLFLDATSVVDLALPQEKPNAPNLSDRMTYWIPSLTYEASTPPAYVDIQSNGKVSGSNSLARVSVRLMYDPPALFDYGLFADAGIELGGQGDIDSYDACVAPYDPDNPGDKGDIGTNAVGYDAIILNGVPSLVQGSASVGAGGDPSTDITGNGTITGTTDALTEAKFLDPKEAPTGGTFTQMSLSGTQQETLTAGFYRHPYVSIEAQATLYIHGDVTMSISGDLRTAGHGQIVLMSGATLTIYVEGDASIEGNGINNPSQLPSSLTLYGTETSSTIRIAGNADYYGTVYAPTADIEVEGESDLYGALVGQTLHVSSAVHYDECLGKGAKAAGDPFRMVYWRVD